ncbi:TomO hydrophobic C-terminal domain-containing protein [Wolbachia endosymbiont of Tettigetta isshikii]|uniref:TomO hydrophobic C-terminal domain-containing protein n=1 Tax=Wolbachia endosymbiont of Tettigetta isshikii TaxID=3239093 RepID=UPI00397F5059
MTKINSSKDKVKGSSHENGLMKNNLPKRPTVTEQLKIEKEKVSDLENKLKELKSKYEEPINQAQRLETLKGENEKLIGKVEQLKNRVEELKELKKDSKPEAVNFQGVKSKVNYASASFILSMVCAVGASFVTSYLAICATLAIAASVFLALGCYCSYKSNIALSDVKVNQPDNQRLLESSL